MLSIKQLPDTFINKINRNINNISNITFYKIPPMYLFVPFRCIIVLSLFLFLFLHLFFNVFPPRYFDFERYHSYKTRDYLSGFCLFSCAYIFTVKDSDRFTHTHTHTLLSTISLLWHDVRIFQNKSHYFVYEYAIIFLTLNFLNSVVESKRWVELFSSINLNKTLLSSNHAK